jgi:hypothetical protein
MGQVLGPMFGGHLSRLLTRVPIRVLGPACLGLSVLGLLSMMDPVALAAPTTAASGAKTRFLVVGGGGAPSYNEIALEKNLLYFQRTLGVFRLPIDRATMFFANGNSGERTVRYLDGDRERFKAPKIPGLRGPATLANVTQAIGQLAQGTAQMPKTAPLFAYFTGHGSRNDDNYNNNDFILWNERPLSVNALSQSLDRLPPKTPVTLVMVQCYSGSFANVIYRQGDPKRGVASHDRCGFFATIKQLTSVGCTTEVDEADYRDYSSSFFAGLSGVSRTGQRVASADYNKDGRVSYREAHGFAKVDEQASDLPLSTSESWLQDQLSKAQRQRILNQPIAQTLGSARPEQRYVISTLAQKLKLNLNQPFAPALAQKRRQWSEGQSRTYLERLAMEVTNVGAEKSLRSGQLTRGTTQGLAPQLAILDRLLACEGRSWQ